MKKETKIILLVIFSSVALVLGSIFGIQYLDNKTSKSYSLNDYGCENIDFAITTGKCLMQKESIVFGKCFDMQNLYVYYKLNCGKSNPYTDFDMKPVDFPQNITNDGGA